MKPRIEFTVRPHANPETDHVDQYLDKSGKFWRAVYVDVVLLIDGTSHMRDYCLNDFQSIQTCKAGILRSLRTRVANFPAEYQVRGWEPDQLVQAAWL